MIRTEENCLFYAISQDDVGEVKQLLDNGADVNARSITGGYPLWYARDSEKSVEIAKLLIDAGTDVNGAFQLPGSEWHKGCTPLHKFASFCNIDLMSLLIKNGADVNVQNNVGITPFLFLCAYVQPDIKRYKIKEAMKLLVGNNANIHHKLINKGVIELAHGSGNFNVITELLKYDIDKTVNGEPLLFSMFDKVSYFKKFVNAGADINGTLKRGFVGGNLLFISINSDKLSITKFLIKKGIDITHQASNGQTPAICAAISKNKAQLLVLLEAGADPFIEDNCGKSAMDYLTKTDFKHDIEKVLLEKEVDADESLSMGL